MPNVEDNPPNGLTDRTLDDRLTVNEANDVGSAQSELGLVHRFVSRNPGDVPHSDPTRSHEDRGAISRTKRGMHPSLSNLRSPG
jgi:hypothetical protein